MNENSPPLATRRQPWRRLSFWIAIALALYLASYAVNSRKGGYWPHPVHDEKRRDADGRWLATAIHWQPAYGYRSLDESDFLRSTDRLRPCLVSSE